MSTYLTYINASKDYPWILAFQKNAVNPPNQYDLAWMVFGTNAKVRKVGISFEGLSAEFLSTSGVSPRTPMVPGTSYTAEMGSVTVMLKPTGSTGYPGLVTITNGLDVVAQITLYRSGLALAMAKEVAPGATAEFAYDDTLWIGQDPGVGPGDPLTGSEMDAINTGITLTGIVSADVVMTGSDGGPYMFLLEKIVYASG